MSTIEEVYQAAALQKRALDRYEPPAEYIRTQPNWRCVCGNEPESQGFHLWNRASWRYADSEAEALASTPGYGPTYHYRCDRCFRTIVGPQGYVCDPPLMVRAVWGGGVVGGGAGTADASEAAIAGGGVDRPLNVHELEAIRHDVDRNMYRAGFTGAHEAVRLFGYERMRERAVRAVTDPYAWGWNAAMAQMRREWLEAEHSICADCERPLNRGQCEYCDVKSERGE